MKKKTRTTRVYNPDLDEYEWKEVETDKYVFDETDKIAIVREYQERGCPASEIVAKYHISSAVVLYGWIDKYLNEKVCVSLHRQKRITTVYATSDGKSSGASSPAWILPKEMPLWIVPQ